MPRQLDPLESQLLNLVQEQVPLVERPFEAIGQGLALSEDKTIQMLQSLKSGEHRVIRQISAIFDTRALGYRSSLVAAKVAPDRIDEAAAVIDSHPGVSHNYKRNHDYNLWYTIAVPPDSRLGLDKTIQLLHAKSGALQTRLMPTLRLFKIGVKLNLGGEDIASQTETPKFTEEDRRAAMGFEITEADKRMIRVLQQDLPLIARPYDAWAQQAQVGIATLLQAAARYEQQKRMRRFSAVLHHREAGFKANGMGVWVVPADQAESFGTKAATFAAVSHCYLRPTYPDWPYNVFTMVHATDARACDRVLETISAQTGVKEYAALYSSKEYKKVRVQYFTPEIASWEDQNMPG